MPKTVCPDCDGVITHDKPRIGEFIHCGYCGYELEIISTHPFEVDYTLDYDGGEDSDLDQAFEDGWHSQRPHRPSV